jgi:hypothetical protein
MTLEKSRQLFVFDMSARQRTVVPQRGREIKTIRIDTRDDW